jgi:sarcosine oxidase
MKTHFNIIVIGNGLFGSAAAKYLSQAVEDVLLCGVAEPANPDKATVFSSHYDSGRVTRVFGWDERWTQWNLHTQNNLPYIEAASGISVTKSVGCLYVTTYPQDEQYYLPELLCRKIGSGLTTPSYYTAQSLKENFPLFTFKDEAKGYLEKRNAGFLNPRRLIEAQNVLFKKMGGVILPEQVKEMDTHNTLGVHLMNGTILTTEKLLLCCGAFHNFLKGAPRLSMKLKSETVLLAGVPEERLPQWSSLPSLLYEIKTSEYEGVYMVPPVLYPDGKYYLKIGMNMIYDRFFESVETIQHWFRNPLPEINKKALVNVLNNIIPGFPSDHCISKPCVITRTDNRLPIIQPLSDKLYVCTAGNGYGAMASDGIGYTAAQMVLNA